MSTDEHPRAERAQKDGAQRGHPGPRSVEGRSAAVLALMSGKASVDQRALKYGVRTATIEGGREQAQGMGMLGVGAAIWWWRDPDVTTETLIDASSECDERGRNPR